MKISKLFILILLLLGYGCNCHLQQEQKFLEKYGNEDFSDYKGSTLFYRGIDEDGRKMVAGFVPTQQGTCNSCFINAFHFLDLLIIGFYLGDFVK